MDEHRQTVEACILPEDRPHDFAEIESKLYEIYEAETGTAYPRPAPKAAADTARAALDPAAARWFVEAHQFRIDTEGGIGRPTPEGAHRDGVDLVAVFLVERHAVKGGETRVFALDGPSGQRFTLTEPWSVLLMDDVRVIHETTPVQRADAAAPGHRDTLVITLRQGGFLAPRA